MMYALMARVRALAKDETGATAIEYVIIAGLLAISIILAIQGVGTALQNSFNSISSSVAAA